MPSATWVKVDCTELGLEDAGHDRAPRLPVAGVQTGMQLAALFGLVREIHARKILHRPDDTLGGLLHAILAWKAHQNAGERLIASIRRSLGDVDLQVDGGPHAQTEVRTPLPFVGLGGVSFAPERLSFLVFQRDAEGLLWVQLR